MPKGSATVYNATPWNNYNIVEKTIIACVDGIYYSLNGYAHSAEVTSHPDLYTGSLTIPATFTYEGRIYEVNSIAMNAFEQCSDLTELTLSTATPPAADPTIFIDCMGLTTIHIPDGSMAAYNCAPWSGFTLVDASRERLIQLVTEVETLRNGATLKSMPEGAADFSNHGVLVSADQLSTNKQETTEGPIANLLDNNTSSYFHSTWSSNNSTGEFHYLEVDLLMKLQRLVLKHYRRDHQNNAEPKRVRVYATNDRSEAWTEIGVTTFAAETGVDRIDLGGPYRYIRLVVLETFGGTTTANNLFFTWTELGIWNDAWQEAVIPSGELTRQANELLDEARADVTNIVYDVTTIQRLQQLRDYLATGQFAGAENVDISFNRKSNHTGWQSLYVPYDIAYDDIADDFVVAELNNFHQYDDDSDGTFDRTELEVLLLKSGNVIAHHTPYVIRAKETGTHSISLPGATVYASVNNTMDCSSTKIRYVFHGTYQGVSGADMYANNYYAMSNGSLCKANSINADLSAFRWYLSMEDRNSTLSKMPAKIKIVCIDDDTTTDISEVEVTSTDENAPIYDLNGRFVGRKAQLNNLPKGVYIINGKKVLR